MLLLIFIVMIGWEQDPCLTLLGVPCSWQELGDHLKSCEHLYLLTQYISKHFVLEILMFTVKEQWLRVYISQRLFPLQETESYRH